MIAIIDYGVGNLFSLQSSLKFIGADAEVTNDIAKIKAADRIILPGVGAFADAIRKLRESGMEQVVLEEAANGKPLLGICLGMQMLLEKSYEYGEHAGLGLIGGSVKPIAHDWHRLKGAAYWVESADFSEGEGKVQAVSIHQRGRLCLFRSFLRGRGL